jgi:hypothetical protein
VVPVLLGTYVFVVVLVLLVTPLVVPVVLGIEVFLVSVTVVPLSVLVTFFSLLVVQPVQSAPSITVRQRAAMNRFMVFPPRLRGGQNVLYLAVLYYVSAYGPAYNK